MTTLTDDQVKVILDTKEKLKGLAKLQKEEKAILRQPHDKAVFVYDKTTYKGIEAASWLMGRTGNRATKISELHIEYNKLRGKEWRMHERKKK